MRSIRTSSNDTVGTRVYGITISFVLLQQCQRHHSAEIICILTFSRWHLHMCFTSVKTIHLLMVIKGQVLPAVLFFLS